MNAVSSESSEQVINTILPTVNGSNGTVKRKLEEPVKVHELGIEKRQLIPGGRKNCHCLQNGMKQGNIVLLAKTKEGQGWIIFFPSKKKNLLHALTSLNIYGIGKNPDGGEVVVKAEVIKARGHSNLKELLLDIKDPALNLEEIPNPDKKTGEISAFFISVLL